MESADELLRNVARTGSTQNHTSWANVKLILSQKIKNIEKDFFDSSTSVEDTIPQYPNVDNFNFDRLKASLLDRLELFVAPPFTIQRMCELLVEPKKQYSRIDKFMRALEKNILVVSTVTDGGRRQSENDTNLDISLNGSGDVEASIEQKSSDEDQQDIDSCNEDEKKPQETNKESSFHRLDDDESESPSPKKMKLDKISTDDEIEDIELEKMSEQKEQPKTEDIKENIGDEEEEQEQEPNTDVKDTESQLSDQTMEKASEKPNEENYENKSLLENETKEIMELTKETQVEETEKSERNETQDADEDAVLAEEQLGSNDKKITEEKSEDKSEPQLLDDTIDQKEEAKDSESNRNKEKERIQGPESAKESDAEKSSN